ncbi:MAG TPA: GH3 auxin-responsive promoter family protein, partial [bacterium]|nr:GH3 auxin-responsive promoter family protein [bacterium]
MSRFGRILLKTSGAVPTVRFQFACERPMVVQERLLRHIIRSNEDTAFGKEHHFDQIHSIADFQRQLPIGSYEYHEPYIQKMLQGEPRQLTAQPPILFAMTSGTTGRRKYIPVTQESRVAKSKVMRVWLHLALREHPGILNGRILSVVSPEIEGYTSSGIPYGAESGHAYKNLPLLIRQQYCVPHDVFTIKDYDSRYYVLLRMAVEQEVSTIATCNPSTIVLLCERMDLWKEDILKDIYAGTIRDDLVLPDDIRSRLQSHIEPNPDRARVLESCISRNGGVLAPNCCWDKLVMVSCWKAGSVKLYLRDFPRFFPHQTAVRDWGYLASELRGSIPISDSGEGGVLTIDTNFFEFLPEEESESSQKNYLTVDQLSVGQRYYVYVTTLGGLYRYEMNDLVEVTGFFRSSPEIQFIRKSQGFCSVTGEKLYEDQ